MHTVFKAHARPELIPQSAAPSVQRVALRTVIQNQISVCKLFGMSLKYRQPVTLPADWFQHLSPPPLGGEGPAAAVAPLHDQARALRALIVQKVRERAQQQQQLQQQHHQQQQQQQGQQQPPGPPQPPAPAAAAREQPGQQHAAAPAAGPQQEGAAPGAAAAAAAGALEPVRLTVRQGPLYTAAPVSRGAPLAPGFLPVVQVTADVATLVRAEYERMTQG
jgi:hypothetical protein